MKTIQKTLLSLIILGSLSIAMANGADTYKKCSSCHGAQGERKALGKSAVIKGWNTEKLVTALKGYKDGTYGGPMKGLMKAQVSALDDTKIQDVAEFIAAQQ